MNDECKNNHFCLPTVPNCLFSIFSFGVCVFFYLFFLDLQFFFDYPSTPTFCLILFFFPMFVSFLHSLVTCFFLNVAFQHSSFTSDLLSIQIIELFTKMCLRPVSGLRICPLYSRQRGDNLHRKEGTSSGVIVRQARLANIYEWVRVSLCAPFIRLVPHVIKKLTKLQAPPKV